MGGYAPLRNEDNYLELGLSLDGEVLDGEVLFPLIGQALAESAIILVSSDTLGSLV